MNLAKTALIIEGVGLRGIFASGALHFLMEKEIRFPYVIGVSMGACNAANYVSWQIERNRIVNTKYVDDHRYISYVRLITKGELFGMDFIFDTIPRFLVPFDYKTFEESSVTLIMVVTDCRTGEALYYDKRKLGEGYVDILKASCSLPFIAKPVQYNGRLLMDGGLSDSIPLSKSMKDGNTKHVLILTRPKGYRKKPSPFIPFIYMRYPWLMGVCKAFARRHIGYNKTMDTIETLEEEGKIFVIRPSTAIPVGRAERDKRKLYDAYDEGYSVASLSYDKLCSYFL
jgi:predicted patatin/cPLA2 family phospholipase